MEMIESKIRVLEDRIITSCFNYPRKKGALRRFKSWLTQIDFTAEYVPMVSVDRLMELFIDLKGSELTLFERELVYELIAIKQINRIG